MRNKKNGRENTIEVPSGTCHLYHTYLAFMMAGAIALIANTSASSGVLTCKV